MDLAALNARFEHQPAGAIVRWAVDEFRADRICIAASMQDAVLLDVALRVDPRIEVLFIDTGLHFPETLDTVRAVEARYGITVRVESTPRRPWPDLDPAGCCSEAKVEALTRGLRGKAAWMSGLRRAEASTRSDAPIVSLDRRGLVKLNPLAQWSDLDVAGYVADHDVPVNPLVHRGYPSIGCAPCTRPVAAGADPRSGRWAGSDKTECGLHV